MDLHRIPIVEAQISRNWKKQLEHAWNLAISSRDQFKSKKINLFWESSGLSCYYFFDLKWLETTFEIDYSSALERFSKGQLEFLINSYVRN